MAIEVNLQSVSPEATNRSPAALRQPQIAPQDNQPDTLQRIQEARQTVAAKQQEVVDSRQSIADVNQIVVQLKEQAQNVTRQLEFRVDEQSGRTLIRVTDRETGKLIREIPSQEMVELGQRLRELAETLHRTKQNSIQNSDLNLTGLLVKKQA